jgi:hypothetical protein
LQFKKGNWKQGLLFFGITIGFMALLAAIAAWQGWFQTPA